MTEQVNRSPYCILTRKKEHTAIMMVVHTTQVDKSISLEV